MIGKNEKLRRKSYKERNRYEENRKEINTTKISNISSTWGKKLPKAYALSSNNFLEVTQIASWGKKKKGAFLYRTALLFFLPQEQVRKKLYKKDWDVMNIFHKM